MNICIYCCDYPDNDSSCHSSGALNAISKITPHVHMMLCLENWEFSFVILHMSYLIVCLIHTVCLLWLLISVVRSKKKKSLFIYSHC